MPPTAIRCRPMRRKITPRLAETRTLELNAWETARLVHAMDRAGSYGSWTPEERDLWSKLSRLWDVDMNHRGRESGPDVERAYIPRGGVQSLRMPGMM
jgi:hypothetical protein